MLKNLKGERVFIWLALFICLVAIYFVNPWQKIIGDKIISWDGAGYYLYLPSAFIYHDFLRLHYIPKIFYQYEFSGSFYQAFKVDNGNYVLNYPLGVAILQLPFFLIAHLVAHLTSYPADGFSTPYQFMVVIAGFFYSSCGLILLYKLLCKYFTTISSFIACVAIFLGTNLYNYGFVEADMSHAYIFFLFCVILYLTDKWYKQATLITSLLLGFSAGLIIICRPTLLVALIIPLFWKVNSLRGVKQNLHYIQKHLKGIFFALMAGALPIALQMAYWKYATGNWLFNTYGSQGLGFDFGHPRLYLGLLGARKGWLVYTPLVMAMLAGFFIPKKYKPFPFFSFILYLVIDIWIVFSWKNWDYGGGFSARAMVEAYIVLAFPFAALIEFVNSRKIWRVALFSFISLCCLLNLFQTWQYFNGIIYSSGASSVFEYRKLFFSTVRDLTPAYWLNRDGLLQPGHITSTKTVIDTFYTPGSAPCDVNNQYFGMKALSGRKLKSLNANRVRFTVKAGYGNTDSLLFCNSADIYLTLEHKGKIYFCKALSIPSEFKMADPGTKTMELEIPSGIKDSDESKFFITNSAPISLFVYEEKIEVLQTK